MLAVEKVFNHDHDRDRVHKSCSSGGRTSCHKSPTQQEEVTRRKVRAKVPRFRARVRAKTAKTAAAAVFHSHNKRSGINAMFNWSGSGFV